MPNFETNNQILKKACDDALIDFAEARKDIRLSHPQYDKTEKLFQKILRNIWAARLAEKRKSGRAFKNVELVAEFDGSEIVNNHWPDRIRPMFDFVVWDNKDDTSKGAFFVELKSIRIPQHEKKFVEFGYYVSQLSTDWLRISQAKRKKNNGYDGVVMLLIYGPLVQYLTPTHVRREVHNRLFVDNMSEIARGRPKERDKMQQTAIKEMGFDRPYFKYKKEDGALPIEAGWISSFSEDFQGERFVVLTLPVR